MPSAGTRLVATGPTAPREFLIGSREISIGSAPGNDLVIAEPTVSRRHAKIARQRAGCLITDLESTNGTFVNGERVRGSVAFKIGDELRFGAASYSVSAAAPRRRRAVSIAAVVAFLFAAGFGAAEYLIDWDRIEGAAEHAGAGTNPSAGAGSPVAEISSAPTAGSSLAAATPLAPIVSATPLTPPAAPGPTRATSEWLAAVNRYRVASGLAPVVDDAATSRGATAHARYLMENYKDYLRRDIGLGARMHEEDSSNRWYTPDGASAANASDIAEWPGPVPPPSLTWAVDGWISGPFHRLSILNPALRHAGYGNYCDGPLCIVALNVLRDAASVDFAAAPPKPVEFPPDGSSIAMNSAQGEWPDPLTACPGYAAPSGLPVTLQLAMFHPVKLESYSIMKEGGAPLATCGIDATNYVNPDAEAQRRGRDTMTSFGAVILVPRAPLEPGKYDVSITADGRHYSWSFSIVS